MKEHEVNRGRATFTLIDEIFNASKGGRPVSISALKGFAFAWLFPRTLIVVGSILTGAILLAQTVILYQQTRLIQGQTAAAQLDQTEKLRLRIPETLGLQKGLQESLETLLFFSPPLPACTIGCEVRLADLLNELSTRQATGGSTPSGLSQPAQAVLRTVEAMVLASDRRMLNEANSKRSLESILSAAGPRCFAPIDVVEKVLESVKALDGWKRAGPVWNDPTHTEAIGRLQGLRHESASLTDFRRAVWKTAGDAAEGMRAISAMCDAQLKRDIATLTEIEGPKEEK